MLDIFLYFSPDWNIDVLLSCFNHKDAVRQDNGEEQDKSHLGQDKLMAKTISTSHFDCWRDTQHFIKCNNHA